MLPSLLFSLGILVSPNSNSWHAGVSVVASICLHLNVLCINSKIETTYSIFFLFCFCFTFRRLILQNSPEVWDVLWMAAWICLFWCYRLSLCDVLLPETASLSTVNLVTVRGDINCKLAIANSSQCADEDDDRKENKIKEKEERKARENTPRVILF